GGLSGPVLADRSREVLRLLRGALPEGAVIISCGGVTTAADVQERLDAGADLGQGYTAMIYDGSSWPGSLAPQLAGGCARARPARDVTARAYPGGMDEDLFSLSGDAPAPRTLSDRNRDHRAPLAVRMRPRTLDEVVGQHAALEPGSPLRRLVSSADTRPAPAPVLLSGP